MICIPTEGVYRIMDSKGWNALPPEKQRRTVKAWVLGLNPNGEDDGWGEATVVGPIRTLRTKREGIANADYHSLWNPCAGDDLEVIWSDDGFRWGKKVRHKGAE